MTEEKQKSPEATTTATTTQPADQNVANTTETTKVKEGGKKEKCRPMTKVSFFKLI